MVLERGLIVNIACPLDKRRDLLGLLSSVEVED